MVWSFFTMQRIVTLIRVILPFLVIFSIVSISVGLTWVMFFVPDDIRHSNSVQIMFIHVPVAFMSSGMYIIMALSSLSFLIWRHIAADLVAHNAAIVGGISTFLTLITGSLWGKPMWGTLWVWDARLTSVLILLFIYIGYMALRSIIDSFVKRANISAVYCLVGVIMIPIIRYSVYWWHTLHQKFSITFSGSDQLHNVYLYPLLLMIVSFYSIGLLLVIFGVRKDMMLYRGRFLRDKIMQQKSREGQCQ